MLTGDRYFLPHFPQRIPNVPTMTVVEIALRAPSPTASSERLIHIEFQRLRPIALINVKPQIIRKGALINVKTQIISEVRRVSASTDWSPVEFVGVGMLAGQCKFRRRSIQ